MTCAHCGAPLEDASLFCGTCGRSTSTPARGAIPVAGPPTLVEPPEAERVSAPLLDTRPDPGRDATVPAREAETVPEALPEATISEATIPEPTRAEPLLPVPVLPPPSDGGVRGIPDDDPLVDLDSTVLTGPSTPRFVLQFSTGESVTVRGDGLIGRGPVREPGEAVDQLIALADAGRSVSKTHVGFGQDRGRFWVSDRYSTNGTVVRPPDGPARHCEPGRRYLVARGTRVDIGDQFFVVS